MKFTCVLILFVVLSVFTEPITNLSDAYKAVIFEGESHPAKEYALQKLKEKVIHPEKYHFLLHLITCYDSTLSDLKEMELDSMLVHINSAIEANPDYYDAYRARAEVYRKHDRGELFFQDSVVADSLQYKTDILPVFRSDTQFKRSDSLLSEVNSYIHNKYQYQNALHKLDEYKHEFELDDNTYHLYIIIYQKMNDTLNIVRYYDSLYNFARKNAHKKYAKDTLTYLYSQMHYWKEYGLDERYTRDSAIYYRAKLERVLSNKHSADSLIALKKDIINDKIKRMNIIRAVNEVKELNEIFEILELSRDDNYYASIEADMIPILQDRIMYDFKHAINLKNKLKEIDLCNPELLQIIKDIEDKEQSIEK